MTGPCQARRYDGDLPCGRIHRPGSAVGERHARIVEAQQERAEKLRRKVGGPADWCGHVLGARYTRGGVTDTWPCEKCGVGCEGTRQDDGGWPERIGCCREEECGRVRQPKSAEEEKRS